MPKQIIETLETLSAKQLDLKEDDEEPVLSAIPDDSESEDDEPKTIQKSKRPRTDKQIAAFAKVIEKRTEQRQIRAKNREKEAAEKKKELEQKILKKAISIKKKEIKRELAIDEISSDDEPIESIKKKVVVSKAVKVATVAKVVPPIPKYIFV